MKIIYPFFVFHWKESYTCLEWINDGRMFIFGWTECLFFRINNYAFWFSQHLAGFQPLGTEQPSSHGTASSSDQRPCIWEWAALFPSRSEFILSCLKCLEFTVTACHWLCKWTVWMYEQYTLDVSVSICSLRLFGWYELYMIELYYLMVLIYLVLSL